MGDAAWAVITGCTDHAVVEAHVEVLVGANTNGDWASVVDLGAGDFETSRGRAPLSSGVTLPSNQQRSHGSPMPSASASSWSGLGTVTQLSTTSWMPSPSSSPGLGQPAHMSAGMTRTVSEPISPLTCSPSELVDTGVTEQVQRSQTWIESARTRSVMRSSWASPLASQLYL